MLLDRDTYVTVILELLPESFFVTRWLLSIWTHVSSNIQKMLESYWSCMDNLFLVEFKEIPLKCVKEFQDGLQISIDSPL